MEKQILGFLRWTYIPENVHRVAAVQFRTNAQQQEAEQRARILSIERAHQETSAQLAELTGLRLRNLLAETDTIRFREQPHQVQVQCYWRTRGIGKALCRALVDLHTLVCKAAQKSVYRFLLCQHQPCAYGDVVREFDEIRQVSGRPHGHTRRTYITSQHTLGLGIDRPILADSGPLDLSDAGYAKDRLWFIELFIVS